MDEIAVDVVEAAVGQGFLQRRAHPFRAVVGVPQLGGDKDVRPLDRPCCERLQQRISHRVFVAVAFRAIQVSEAHFQCRLGGIDGLHRIRDQGPESGDGDRAGSVVKGNPGASKRVRLISMPAFLETSAADVVSEPGLDVPRLVEAALEQRLDRAWAAGRPARRGRRPTPGAISASGGRLLTSTRRLGLGDRAFVERRDPERERVDEVVEFGVGQRRD